MLRVLYVDMNSYFASVEQQLRPELRGLPVAVVPVDTDSTSCIAASYEAKAFGIRTGTNVGDAKRLCPGLVCVKGRPDMYVRVHHQVLEAVETVLPVNAVHSIDEASCLLLGVQRDPAVAKDLALKVKAAISTRVGSEMRCSIGLAPNRFLAKVAGDMQKPDGLTIIQRHELPHKLHMLKLTDLPGIGAKMAARLNASGIYTVEHLCALSEAEMTRAWKSVVGKDWYAKLRGDDLRDLPTHRRSVGHSHVLAPEHRPEERARAVAVRLITKAAARARNLGYAADFLTVSVRFWLNHRDKDHFHRTGYETSPSLFEAPPTSPPTRWSQRIALGGTHDTVTILRAFATLWEQKPKGSVLKLAVTLHDLTADSSLTKPLFGHNENLDKLSQALDKINKKYGSDTLYPASMHDARKSAPRRIAFGNIPDLDMPDVDD